MITITIVYLNLICIYCFSLQAWEGYTEVPKNIMSGYKLIAHEVIEQLEEMKTAKPTHVILQVGVGSFAAAIADYLRESAHSEIKIITIEPVGSACLYHSLKAGRKTDLDPNSPETISVGLDCGVVSDLAWPVLRNDVDVAVTITDDVAADGVRATHAVGIDAGESGAATGIGFLRHIWKDQDKRGALGIDSDSVVLIFNTEGLTNPELHDQLIAEPLAPLDSLSSNGHINIHCIPIDRHLCLPISPASSTPAAKFEVKVSPQFSPVVSAPSTSGSPSLSGMSDSSLSDLAASPEMSPMFGAAEPTAANITAGKGKGKAKDMQGKFELIDLTCAAVDCNVLHL